MSFKRIDTNEFITAAREYKVFEGYKCGLKCFDEIMRIDKQTLTTLVATPASGKSTFTNFYGYRMAKNQHWKTLYIATETPKARQCRLLSVLFNSATKASEFSVIYDHDLSDWQELLDMIKDAKETYGVDMVIIDNFTMISELIENVKESANIGMALSALKKASIDNDIAVILVTHPTKINEGQKVTAYSVNGSANFFNISDFMFTLTADRDKFETTINVLKVRDDTKGQMGGECTLSYNKVTLKYSDTDSTEDTSTPSQPTRQQDISNNIATDVMKAIMEEETQEDSQPATPATQPAGTTKAAPAAKEEAITEEVKKEKQETAKQHITPDFLTNTKVSIMERHNILKICSLYNSIIMGKEHKKEIEAVRQIDRQANESEYKKAKEKVLSYTPSCVCAGTTAKEIKQVNPLIAVDLDEKDNKGLSIEEMRTKINSLPYVMYSSLSVGGKGMYALIPIAEANKNDFKGLFKALEEDFIKLGLKLDGSCVNVNRERYMSIDKAEYWNTQCEIYTKKLNIPTQVLPHLGRVGVNANKPLTLREKQKVDLMIEDIKQNKIQLSKNHDDTLGLANAIANIWGEDGRELLHLIRSQREGYDEFKTDSKFDYILNHLDEGERYGLGLIFTKYKEAKQGQTQVN
nr:AAA family ATPase [uncultured Prevotella sp.]